MNDSSSIRRSLNSSDDDIIRGRLIDMNDELTDVIKENDPIGSPAVALKRDVKRPGYWSHMTECTCWKCKDLVSVGLDMKYFMLQAQCLIEQGEVGQGEKHWSALVEVTDDLVLQAQQTWSRDILKELLVSKKKSVRPQHETLLLELSLMQAEYRLSVQDNTTHASFTNQSPASGTSLEYWLRQAEKLMGGTGSEELYHQRADLGYLDGVPSLPWPRQSSEIEELCQGIGRVKLSELNVPTPNTHVSTPVNTHRKPKLNQVKKINRAKPMVGVKKERKTSGKILHVSDDSPVMEIDSLDSTDDKISPLSTQGELIQPGRRARKSSEINQKADSKSMVSAPEKRGRAVSHTGRAKIISATEPVTIFNDENFAPLAPKKSSRRAQSSTTVSQKRTTASKESRKSRETDSVSVTSRNVRNGRKISTNSQLDYSDVFEPSPAHKMSPLVKAAKHSNRGDSLVKSPGSLNAHSPRVRTPVSCSSKKGKLLRDLESDSDNEEKLLTKRNTGKAVRGKKTGTKSAKPKASAKERDESKSSTSNGTSGSSSLSSRIPKHVLHEVQNSPLLTTPVSISKSTSSRLTNSAIPSRIGKSKASETEKGPVHSLFRKTLTKTLSMDIEDHDESIFDFVASSPEESVNSKRRKPTTSKSTNPKAAAARSKLSLKTRRAKTQDLNKDEDVETARKHKEERSGVAGIYDFDECADCDDDNIDCDNGVVPSQNTVNNKKCTTKSKEVKTKEKKPAKPKAKSTRTTGRGRLIRATTAVTEETRTRDR